MDDPIEDAVADAAMDAKMRQIWDRIEKRWVRDILRQMLPPTPVHALGCDFVVHPKDNFTEFVMWERGLPPEHVATTYIADQLAGSAPVIVDVGANAGAFSLPIHKAGGAGTTSILFEPNPVMQARLRKNVALNGFDDDIRIFECAVGDAAGTSVLHFPRSGNLGQGRVNVAYGHKKASEGVEVQIRTLTDCLEEAGTRRVDFLKVDVEGLEDRVIVPLLKGDKRLWPAMIYFEVAHDGVWGLPLLQELETAGYAQEHAFENNALYVLRG